MKKEKSEISLLKLFFLISFLCLLALSVFSYIHIRRLVTSAEIVNHTNIVKLELERSFSYLKEAETNQRGYLISKNPVFLETYTLVIRAMEGQFDKLRSLLKDNPQQQQNLSALITLSRKRVEYLQLLIDNEKTNTATGKTLLPGKEIMDKVRYQIQKVMNVEDGLLRKRNEILTKNVFVTPFISLLLIIFSLILLIYFYWGISKRLLSSTRLSKQLTVQNEKIAERNEFIEAVLNASVDLIAVIDRDHRLLVVNKKAAEFFRAKEQEVIGKKLEALRPEIKREQAYINIDIAFGGKAVHIPEYKSPVDEKYWELNFIPLPPGKTVENVMVIAHNITDMIVATNELKMSEERYHLMASEVVDYAIILLNEQGIIQNWNKGAQNIKGYDAEEIIGKSFEMFYPDEDRRNMLPQKLIGEARRNGKALHEGWRLRKDGTLFWGSIVITCLYNSKKEIVGFSKVTRDLTEKKLADDKIKKHAEVLEQKNTELANMNRELQSFAYVSSHDLQEPLRKIQTFSDRILDLEYEGLSEKGKDYFRRMKEAAKRMQKLIEDLLEYASTNRTDRKFEKVDLGSVVQELKNEFNEAIDSRNVEIEYAGVCIINIIPFQFKQLLHNLFSNSIKFSKPDINPHIKITCQIAAGKTMAKTELQPDVQYAHIQVSDNGIGFDPQYSKRIFEVFQRLHGRHEFQGTGIGLAICKKIVDNHHGFISAEGLLNEGARFDIYIPAS